MREKILNLSFYFGFVPFYRIACALKGRECRRSKHYYQALAISGITFIGFIAFVVSFGIHSLIFLYSPDIALKLPLELSFYVLTTFILVSVGLIMDGVTGVIMGHNPRIPLHAWISSSNIRVIATTVIMIVQILVIIIGVFVIIHSTKIVEDSSDKTEIYMLYDDMGYVPRWVYTTGFYFESLAANAIWGQGSVSIIPLSYESMNNAISKGRLVFVASHGVDGYIVLPSGELFGPENIEDVGSKLEYVYLSGCETGSFHDEWELKFSPAEVKTFDRLSTTIEHMYWLLIDGREIINALE